MQTYELMFRSCWSTSSRNECETSPSAALSSGVIPTPPAPTVVPPQVLALDFGAYDTELEPEAMGDNVAVTAVCVCVMSTVSSVLDADITSVLAAPVVGVSSAVVHGWLVASVPGLKLAAAAAAVACFSRVYDCHDLRRSVPDVIDIASAWLTCTNTQTHSTERINNTCIYTRAHQEMRYPNAT